MRRWLSILLLMLLPYQFSWAAVGTYCEHETGARAEHFGHHEHQHRQPAGRSGEAFKAPLSAALDVDDCHFHAQWTADVPGVPAMQLVVGGQPPTDRTSVDVRSPSPSRPERPRWLSHA